MINDSTYSMRRRGQVVVRLALVMLTTCVVLLTWVAGATAQTMFQVNASFGGGTVGQTNNQAAWSVTNISDGNQILDPVELTDFLVIPSCRYSGGCAPSSADLGVYTFSSTATGSGACQGTFTVTVANPANGQLRFTPAGQVILEPAFYAGGNKTCSISFTSSVDRMPTFDASADAGVQTFQSFQVTGVNHNDAVGPLTFDDINLNNVYQATPTVTENATDAYLGSGISNSATLVGAAANPTGTMTINAYAPGDTACAGAAVFSVTTAVAGNGAYDSGSFTPNTTGAYHWSATYSGDVNNAGFTTGCNATDSVSNVTPLPPQPPLVVTNAASAVTTTGATISGKVNPSGFATSYSFQYGTTTAYGAQTTTQSAGSGATDVDATTTLAGLSAGTTYHYRLVATNAGGTTNGVDATFTTLAAVVVRKAPASLSAASTPRRDRSAPYRYAVKGRLGLPAGVSATQACNGYVTVKFKLGTRLVKTVRAKVGSNCSYAAVVGITRRSSRTGKFQVLVSFAGNTALTQKTAPAFSVRFG